MTLESNDHKHKNVDSEGGKVFWARLANYMKPSLVSLIYFFKNLRLGSLIINDKKI